MTATFNQPRVEESQLSWSLSDPERQLAFSGARFTQVGTWCPLLLGTALSIGFYGVLMPLQDWYIASTFTQRGVIPYVIVVLFCWSLAILGLKFLKLRLQRRLLTRVVVPEDPQFVLTPQSVEDVYHRIYATVDDPRQFVLSNRLMIALSNLRNLGRVGDVDEILHTQAANDESAMETSYSLLLGFVWAIPVLGFIGTVQGLSMAIGSFGSVLSAASEIGQLKDALKEVTAGLSIAFETTMHGLVAALLIQLLLTALKKSEEEFLDGCSDYCTRHVVSRLRLMPFEE